MGYHMEKQDIGRFRTWGSILLSTFYAIACFANQGAGAQSRTDDIIGPWLTEDGVSVVEITACKESRCGYVVSFPPIAGEPSINHELCNAQILGDLKRDRSGHWGDGWIADLDGGAVYRLAIRITDPDKIEIRIYEQTEADGTSVSWSRASPNFNPCDSSQ